MSDPDTQRAQNGARIFRLWPEALLFSLVSAGLIALLLERERRLVAEEPAPILASELNTGRVWKIDYQDPAPPKRFPCERSFFMDGVMVELPEGASPYAPQVELNFWERTADGAVRRIRLDHVLLKPIGSTVRARGVGLPVKEQGLRLMCTRDPRFVSDYLVLVAGDRYRLATEWGDTNPLYQDLTHYVEFIAPEVPDGCVYELDLVVNDHSYSDLDPQAGR